MKIWDVIKLNERYIYKIEKEIKGDFVITWIQTIKWIEMYELNNKKEYLFNNEDLIKK